MLRLADALDEALEARELTDLYERFELPLVRVLAEMEQAGIRIDRDVPRTSCAPSSTKQCDELRAADLRARGRGVQRELHAAAARRSCSRSSGSTPVKKTKTGPSTDADSLQKMAEDHPIVEDLLRYREVEKLRSTYADALPPLVRADGRIHATFKQTDTTTGRISSEAPNLQNVPVRTADGREIRRAFVADDGSGLLTADYSQIELRVLAHLAEDPGLIDAFDRGADIHTATAAKVFDVAEGEVDDAQRRFAKVVNYGLAYGMEAYGLGQRLDIPTERGARDPRRLLRRRSRTSKAYMIETVARGEASAATPPRSSGGAARSPSSSSDNFRIRQMGERMAQNAPVQGSAADIFKLAMIDLDARARRGRVRDADVAHRARRARARGAGRPSATKVEPVVREVMENVTELRVPLVVDIGFGATWARRSEPSWPTTSATSPRSRFDGRPFSALARPANRRKTALRCDSARVSRTEAGSTRSPRSSGRALPAERVHEGDRAGGRVPGRRARARARAAGARRRVRARPALARARPARLRRCVGVDLSPDFVALARDAAAGGGPRRARSRSSTSATLDIDGEFDAVICLCQGGFGLLGGRDEDDVFATHRRARSVRRARLARLRLLMPPSRSATSRTARRSTRPPACSTSGRPARPTGDEREFDLWTTCFTARELELLAARPGLASTRSTV